MKIHKLWRKKFYNIGHRSEERQFCNLGVLPKLLQSDWGDVVSRQVKWWSIWKITTHQTQSKLKFTKLLMIMLQSQYDHLMDIFCSSNNNLFILLSSSYVPWMISLWSRYNQLVIIVGSLCNHRIIIMWSSYDHCIITVWSSYIP
jgi:hypothetical protein